MGKVKGQCDLPGSPNISTATAAQSDLNFINDEGDTPSSDIWHVLGGLQR